MITIHPLSQKQINQNDIYIHTSKAPLKSKVAAVVVSSEKDRRGAAVVTAAVRMMADLWQAAALQRRSIIMEANILQVSKKYI